MIEHGFETVVLWTDACFFLLLGAFAVGALHAWRRPHLRRSWARVGERPAGMAAMVVLLVFLLIGILDSLHFRAALPPTAGQTETVYATEVTSVLDVVMHRQRTDVERTYSAPLATHAFVKETVELPDGGQRRDFPRLVHGGAHLEDAAQDHGADIASHLMRGAAVGVGLSLLAAAVLSVFNGGVGRLIRGQTQLAWRSAWLTWSIVAVVAGMLLSLAQGYHVFGTDKVGQDVFYLTLKSVRTALMIGTLTTLVTLPLAIALGILAGYFGGWVDDVIQYLYTVLNSIPGVLLIAAAVLMMQVFIENHPEWFATAAERSDARLLALCFILGMTSWTGLCRLLRGETLKLRELEYVQAARAFGVPTVRILLRHVLPNLMHIVIIALVMDFSGLVLAEAVLSYVGIGVDPNMASFGTLINAARMELARDPMVWWSLAAAFVFMFVLVLAANLLADVVRDAFDPRAG
ncbi:ABC transporter permease [Denitromonas ohlonensis]|uniref:ABC transporter permease n=2 Tax=Denitromonas TaxID=139331 RepID=A0A557SPK9_9RHOO|nr:ABC transporter permease [Denitromonas ohlonensis]TVT49941.1 MAG: ABC transporter permease [Denitromonas halophila]TVO65735.1 ABC transporter permease [Denitromonas ohlonensis]TVO79328.1 ABC transporter permease [Denitromonas ohlonensis]TVT67510.1 MAG: ABC transporter permease [Denitromonas halophila]TVT70219.1 MAG: ABC transporter permease [Denitromonas halophila]